MIPAIAILTLSFENVRFDFNVILFAIKAERFKSADFVLLANMQILPFVLSGEGLFI